MGVLTGFSDPRVQLPGGTPAASGVSPLLAFLSQPRGALSQQAYQLAGSPQRGPLSGPPISAFPSSYYSGDAPAPAGGGILGNLQSANSIYKNGSKLYNSLTGPNPAVGADPSSISSLGSAGLGSVGAGALLGTSGAGALGAAAPIASDAALSNLGTVTAGQLFGTSASAASGAGAGSLGAEGGAGVLGAGTGASTGSGFGAALAGSGASTAIPLAAIGFAVAQGINKSIGVGNQSALSRAWADSVKATPVYSGRLETGSVMPNGKFYNNPQITQLSQAWAAGDTAKYDQLLNSFPGTPDGGYVVKNGRLVKG